MVMATIPTVIVAVAVCDPMEDTSRRSWASMHLVSGLGAIQEFDPGSEPESYHPKRDSVPSHRTAPHRTAPLTAQQLARGKLSFLPVWGGALA